MAHDFDAIIDRRPTESSKWHKYPPDVLPLWVADMDFRSPEPVIRALRERVEHGVFGYGHDEPEFHELICERLAKRYGWRVAPEAVLTQPGVIPSFNLAARILAQPGDGVLMATPLYPPLLRVPANCGLTSDEALLSEDADGRYAIDWEAIERAIQPRTRMLLLCNPHNPVGRVYRRDELTRLAQLCLSRGLAICADEIHCDLVFDGARHVPIASLDPEVERRTITLMAPSKTWNLPGLKASIAIIPDADLRARFVAAHMDLVRAVNVLGYVAMVAAYRDGQPWLDDLLRYLEGNRDFLVATVRRDMPGVRVAPPEATVLAWLDCRRAGIPGEHPYTFFLDKARVALNDGKTFGHGGDGFVRINFACPRATLAEALRRMATALREHAPAGVAR
jgi:cystathionine beta-lyase